MEKTFSYSCLLQQQGVALVAQCAKEAGPALGGSDVV